MISTDSITTGSTGRSPGPVAVVPIASTTSRLSWSATSPKIVCRLFSQVVGAYMDVILQEAVVGLNANNVNVLTVNVESTRDQFQIGSLTRTDVAQSEARLALAQGDLLRVILHSQDASTHVALGVEVRWSKPGANGGVTVAGCRFTGTTALLAGKMLGFVSSGLT